MRIQVKSCIIEQVVRYMSPAQSLQTENQHRIAIDPAWQAENIGVAVLVTSVGRSALPAGSAHSGRLATRAAIICKIMEKANY